MDVMKELEITMKTKRKPIDIKELQSVKSKKSNKSNALDEWHKGDLSLNGYSFYLER